MKIVVKGREVELKPEDVAIVRDATNAFIAAVKDVSVYNNRPELYFTLVIYLYMKAEQTIEAITPKALQYMLDIISAARDAALIVEEEEKLQADEE